MRMLSSCQSAFIVNLSGFELIQQIGGGGFSTWVSGFLDLKYDKHPSYCGTIETESFTSFLELIPDRARVFRAVNVEDHRVAACKMITLTETMNEKDRKSIDKEMRVHSALKHIHVLEFMNAVVVEPKHKDRYVPGIYMLLEFAAGGDLFDKIGDNHIFPYWWQN
jgi:serine/threonine protein kinase